MEKLVALRTERVLLFVSLGLAVLFATLWFRGLHESRQPVPPSSAEVVERATPMPLAGIPRPLSVQASSTSTKMVGSLVQDVTKDEGRFRRHEDRFAHDPRGGAWVNVARESLLDAAAEPALTSFGVPNSFNADCSSRMCRVAMDFDSRTAADDWAEFLPLGMGKEFAAVDTLRTETPDGRHVLLIYGAREGHATLITAN